MVDINSVLHLVPKYPAVQDEKLRNPNNSYTSIWFCFRATLNRGQNKTTEMLNDRFGASSLESDALA